MDRLTSLSEITKAKVTVALLNEIDITIPEVTKLNYDIEGDEDFNSNYSSFMNILFVHRYIEIHPEKKAFRNSLDVNLLKVSELLSDTPNEAELIKFADFACSSHSLPDKG